jgi:NAD(P)-dependent dehydrogenase (short-subunit alcohol dehydrogenase family)
MQFADKIAIITGGAHGIGRATALGLARDGAAVVIADRDAEATRQVVDGIRSWGAQALGIVGDVASEQDAARIAAETVHHLGGIDLLVNSAGVQPAGSIEGTTLDVWNTTIGINLTGTYLVSRFAVPEMRRHGGGAIVNVASIHGLLTQANHAAYAASKGGVVALTRSMALDYADEGIRVNCVCPGAIDTPLLHHAAELQNAAHPETVLHTWARRQPIGRLGTVEEVAELILFLIGPHATFITGAIYAVDGGSSAGFVV